MRRRLLLVILTGLVAVAAGCRTVVTVDIRGDDDGSGTVTVTAVLDAEAVAALGGAEALFLDDLRAAGWQVAEPRPAGDGRLGIEASRRYRDGEELSAVLAEVGGDSIFTDTVSTVEDGFGRTTYRTGTTVSVTGDPASLSDDALTATLGGLPLGRTPEELAAAGVSEPGAGRLVVRVTVPGGGVDEESFDLTGGEASSARVAAEATETDLLVWALVAAAGALAVVAVVLALRGVRRSRRRA